MTEKTDYDRAVAAVRKWLAECERRDRIGRRYTDRANAKRIEAKERVLAARVAAAEAISRLDEKEVMVDERRYGFFRVADGDYS